VKTKSIFGVGSVIHIRQLTELQGSDLTCTLLSATMQQRCQ